MSKELKSLKMKLNSQGQGLAAFSPMNPILSVHPESCSSKASDEVGIYKLQ